MLERRSWPAFLLAALAFVFTVAAARLLEGRLASGKAYPAFSSQKTEPDGARAFYEALGELPGARVRRNFAPLERLTTGPRGTLLFLGVESWVFHSLSRPEIERLETQVRSGARLVFALARDYAPRLSLQTGPPPTHTPDTRSRRRGGRPADIEDEPGPVSIEQRWGFHIDPHERFAPGSFARLAGQAQPAGLPASVPWQAGATLEQLDPSWRTVYKIGGKPVLVERSFGLGTIVFSTDSTFAANAVLKSGRQPELLAWLVGDRTDVVFDETHLGQAEHEGVAALARRYGLEGLAAGLLLLAALFVWKNAIPFAPAPDAAARREAPVLGRRSTESLAAVLRRHVAAADLSRICFDEWRKAFGRNRPAELRELARIAADKDPVSAYRRSSALLKETHAP